MLSTFLQSYIVVVRHKTSWVCAFLYRLNLILNYSVPPDRALFVLKTHSRSFGVMENIRNVTLRRHSRLFPIPLVLYFC